MTEILHKIEVRQKAGTEGKVMTGMNTELLLDGQPVKGCTRFAFEVSARGVAKATLELLVHAAIDAMVEPQAFVDKFVEEFVNEPLMEPIPPCGSSTHV